MTDIEIAKKAILMPITEVAKKLGISEKNIEQYGNFKAKVSNAKLNPKGKLILVTAITPTSAGEGKTTMSIGLADGLNLIGKKVCLALREPSLGPVFGLKGGATGGGYSQVLPMEDINLHFTGDFHAITTANNLLSAMIDNHIHQGNEKNIDINNITFHRCIDLNDRALRNITCGQGDSKNGVPRKDSFDITAASEIMAIMCLSQDIDDLKRRLGNITIAKDINNKPVFARDIKADGAMAVVLKDALKPNLVQTIIGTPAFIHCGPFANIAHGCNSIMATKTAMTYADYTVTEAGFGADLGAEKFIDLKCRVADLKTDAVVVVATIKALKLHGGADKTMLSVENLEALKKGIPNLIKHIENVTKVFKIPAIVAINQFESDTKAELELLIAETKSVGIKAITANVWKNGGEGAKDLANEVVKLCNAESETEYAYNLNDTIKQKIGDIAIKIYGADGVNFTAEAEKDIEFIEASGCSDYPVIIAKTQYSLSDNKDLIGKPQGFTITIRGLQLRTGAGFIVALAGNMMLMPGLGKKPAAVGMDINNCGEIIGLF